MANPEERNQVSPLPLRRAGLPAARAKRRSITQTVTHLVSGFRKKLKLGHSLQELDPYLAGKKLIFEGPPLTPELVGAIKLISPQFHLRPDERSRRFWELNQNGLCWGEYEALEPFLESLATPSRVLDIGPGMGRSVVFFKKIRGWEAVPFHLYESAGSSTRYTKAGPRFEDSFCGNLEVLQAVLRHNEIDHVEIFDAAEMGAQLAQLPGPYDFIYSFFAVGFHWAIDHFLDELLRLMHDRSIGAFTLHDRAVDLGALDQVPHRVVEFRRSWPRGRWSRLLVLSKSEELLEGGG